MNIFRKKRMRRTVSFTAFFLAAVLILIGFERLLYDPFVRSMSLYRLMPFFLAETLFLLPVEIFIVLGLWKTRNLLIRQTDVALPLSSESEIYRVVHRIIQSDEFAAALRPVLPKGEEDKKYGFDYIPFLLRNVDKRRLRFQKSSQIFLFCTLVLAVVFAVILAVLGYILVDEGAAGDALRLNDINHNLEKVRDAIPSLTPDLNKNEAYVRILAPIATKIKSYTENPPDALEESIKAEISNDLDQRDLGKLQTSLETWLSDKNPVMQKRDFAVLLGNLSSGIEQFLQNRDTASYYVQESIGGLKDIVATAQKSIQDNRTPELLKRMAIGLIVATFFLAILKYMSGLYRDHYKQMIQAEQDDLAIRRFYIAFRSASQDPEQRTHVLSTFLSGTNANEIRPEKQEDSDFSPQSQELMKEILKVLAKKAGA